jgi:hypothetical protein
VLFCVSMTFLRSPVLAIFAIVMISSGANVWAWLGCGDGCCARGDLA